MRPRKLRSQILRWLLAALGLVCAASAVDAYFTALRRVNEVYDRSLYGSALAISERVFFAGGRPSVDIPAVALEVLDTPAQERVFYRVGYRLGHGEEVYLTGYSDLPRPPRPEASGPTFYEDRYHGYLLRIAALRRDFPIDPPASVTVLVAETLTGRERLTRALVVRELASQLLLVFVAAGLVWFGVSRGLRPLEEISREVAGRSATDLAPLPLDPVPQEVSRVVHAVNELMGRVRKTFDAQARFIANASHALRTPLAVLRSQAELGLRQRDPAAMRESLERLRDQCGATSHLAGQLLALARVGRSAEQQEASVIDLVTVARDACSALVPAALERDVDLGFEGSGPAPIRGREHQVRELIGNLVDNAIRYGARPGRITVSVSGPEQDMVCLAVEDDGPGIPADQRARVVEPFHRLPGSPGDGAGLGLAIVDEVARGHGAALRLLDGAGGRGLRAEVYFPVGGRPVTP